MDRRTFLGNSAKATAFAGLQQQLWASSILTPDAAAEKAPAQLPGTEPLTMQGDLAAQMVEGVRRDLLSKTAEVAKGRDSQWNRNYSSPSAYKLSVAENRAHLRQIIGAIDERVKGIELQSDRGIFDSAAIGQSETYKVYSIRWPVLEPAVAGFAGLHADGLLLQPNKAPVARIVALPDADWTPEMIVGMAPGLTPQAQFARRLAESGCQVIIPVLIDRADTFSGIPGIGFTNQPHREWIYRMSFEVGRHVVGHEVQKVLAAVDWFETQNKQQAAPIGVIGYGEGGLLALYSGALDTRIQATAVSGYFQEREELWKEPIYRDIWALLCEFGDAEIASLIAPRSLIVEASRSPQVEGPPPITELHAESACPNGKLKTPPLDSVRNEVEKARNFYAGLKSEGRVHLVVSGQGDSEPGSEQALNAFLRTLTAGNVLEPNGAPPTDHRMNYDPQARLKEQFDEMVSFTQGLIHKAPEERKKFWAKANSTWLTEDQLAHQSLYIQYLRASEAGMTQWSNSPEQWTEARKWYRDYVWEEVIGRLPTPSMPTNARTRLVYDEPNYLGYEVMLDVWPDVFAYGVLLIPKGIPKGERRPVVVCQHGLESRVQELTDPNAHEVGLRGFANRLAAEGFVVFAPQGPYIGADKFRIIERMGHPLKLSLYSFILGQHQRILEWLSDLPYVDPAGIGFYGISYGGKSAVTVPPLLEQYAVSVCSAGFNEWVWKTTNIESSFSYLLIEEYDMYDFNFANVINHSELANLMAPRAFMVERGHYDFVSEDQMVAYEYAKVRWFYDYMGIADKTRIEFLNGPHMIYGLGTFEFLRQHLPWKPGRWSPVAG